MGYNMQSDSLHHLRCRNLRFRLAKSQPTATRTVLFALLLISASLSAQDTRYPPKEGLIPVPTCLNEAWVPTNQKLCADQPRACVDQLRQCAQELRAWRSDVFHWRDETR